MHTGMCLLVKRLQICASPIKYLQEITKIAKIPPYYNENIIFSSRVSSSELPIFKFKSRMPNIQNFLTNGSRWAKALSLIAYKHKLRNNLPISQVIGLKCLLQIDFSSFTRLFKFLLLFKKGEGVREVLQEHRYRPNIEESMLYL